MRAPCALLLPLLLLPAAALAQQESQEDEAGDVSEVDKDALGPLRERIPPVSGHLFLKKGRFEFSPSATVSFRDAFFRKYILGGSLTYHPLETLGIGVRAGYSIPTIAGAAQICAAAEAGQSAAACRSPTQNELDGQALGQITLIAGLDAQWAPIYGKIALLAESFAHFDMYAVGGLSAIQYRGPAEVVGGDAVPTFTVGGNVGIGLRFFFNEWITLRTEVRDLIYLEKANALTTSSSLRNQFLFELGVSFFLPTVLPES